MRKAILLYIIALAIAFLFLLVKSYKIETRINQLESGVGFCSDDIDNDFDGRIDCDDKTCLIENVCKLTN